MERTADAEFIVTANLKDFPTAALAPFELVAIGPDALLVDLVQRNHEAVVGDIGAWVSQTTGPTKANVSRTLSLVPVTNQAWRQLVDTHYSHGAEFMNLRWEFPLSRPQAELVATRSTALNECFY